MIYGIMTRYACQNTQHCYLLECEMEIIVILPSDAVALCYCEFFTMKLDKKTYNEFVFSLNLPFSVCL